MEEVWKTIEDFPDYEISSFGNVYSHLTNKVLIPAEERGRYLFVTLRKNGKSYPKKIHRLVAITFIPNPLNLPQVNHKDENCKNNCIDNLEWCTQKYNNNYGTLKERLRLINRRTSPKMIKVAQIKPVSGDILNVFDSIRDASRQTGIDNSCIAKACKKKQYKTAGGYVWEYYELVA